jgi:hypothetical protein
MSISLDANINASPQERALVSVFAKRPHYGGPAAGSRPCPTLHPTGRNFKILHGVAREGRQMQAKSRSSNSIPRPACASAPAACPRKEECRPFQGLCETPSAPSHRLTPVASRLSPLAGLLSRSRESVNFLGHEFSCRRKSLFDGRSIDDK